MILITIAILTVVYVGVHWLIFTLMKVPVDHVKFFVGPSLIKTKIQRTSIEFGILPFAGLLKPREFLFYRLRYICFVAASLSAPVAVFILGLIAIDDKSIVFNEFFNTYLQMYNGAIRPSSDGASMIGSALSLDFRSAFALSGIKMAAINLTPIPLTVMGGILLGRNRNPNAFVMALMYIGLFVVIAMWTMWVIAGIYYLFS